MEKTKHKIVIKGHLINAFLPDFLKHFFWNTLFFLFLYGVYLVAKHFLNLHYDFWLIVGGISFTLIFSIFKIFNDLVKVLNTSYNFYANHFEINYKFFTEKIHSVSYNQITDIQIRKTLWDRMCNVGDIIIHTSNDEYYESNMKAVILKDVKDPDIIKEEISRKIRND